MTTKLPPEKRIIYNIKYDVRSKSAFDKTEQTYSIVFLSALKRCPFLLHQ